ncbi:uncharacterized protein N0V89_000327 [Didymosphaeria variabile]|uniref:Uncharacterized protein n=1 Tax=Didymosphaeria variabile TaxID=1932322 RepID=A0A9W8XV46_9PLEO|nr:uncharacterized protein N0V89_000327 [Didymosphaeria variabile]KAJ4359771.1 hypothetical protein N0V89_000327 [Didymosphaeria variabile]
MGRHRGPKFSFPIPGRKSKVDKSGDDLTKTSSFPSFTSVPSASERPLRYDESAGVSSKAQRLLGTAPPPFRTMAGQSSVPPSPGYMSITVSDTGSDYDDKAASIAGEHGGYRLPIRPALSNRASSNLMPPNAAYEDETNYSYTSRHLHPTTSNSTLRSHYDAKNSPLSISQQTSDSAVRDMALRKGYPQISAHDRNHIHSPLAQEMADDDRRDYRKSKPPRLDLSKLFPKPKGHGGQEFGAALLSPNKLVNSPTAMSTVSDYFPRPMTREPTPTPRTPAKLTKPQPKQPPPAPPVVRPTSPVRLHKRDTYDSAKINVRRPPRGTQHWFDALSDDSDELDEEVEDTAAHASAPANRTRQYPAVKKPSQHSLRQETTVPRHQPSRASQYLADPRRSQHSNTNQNFHGNQYHQGNTPAHRLNSPSGYSLHSQSSLGTARTKGSAFSKSNLQDSSVLSFSSSEDEGESTRPSRRKVSVRDSIDMTEDSGDIVIGQAQAFEVRPQSHSRRPSAGKLSLMSTSTNAATIEVMYTPEPPYTPLPPFPTVHRTSANGRRASHTRQPSVIHEVEDRRPQTARLRSQSPSARSTRTSKSEPKSQEEMRKFMAVTPEEEALLEALRKKRLAMAQQNRAQGYENAAKQEDVRQQTPPERNNKKAGPPAALFSTESPSSSPVRIVETKKKASRKPHAPEPLSLLAPPRGRKIANHDLNMGTSILRDSSSCDPRSGREARVSIRRDSRPLLSPPEFSPLDLFPSPTPTASAASPTTTDHPSPLPSPVTPRMRHGEDDVDVKVASSEPSWNGDNDEVAVIETGIIDPPAGSIKPEEAQAQHQRRRTASSGAEVPFSLPTKMPSTEFRNLTPVTETSTRLPSPGEPPLDPLPKLPKKSSFRNPSLTITTTGLPKSRHNSIVSDRTASPNRSGYPDRRTSRQVSRTGSLASMNSTASIKRDSVAVGTANTRCSISEDVLAAWGSLGGMRDYDTARY